MNLSVIVITAQRLESLKRCVAALRPELLEGDEIVVVSASRPCVERELEKTGAGLRVLESDRMGMPYQRNIGIRAARHGIVAFVDDDAFVQPGWRRALMACYADPAVSSVVGKEILKGYEHVTAHARPGVKWYGCIVGTQHYAATDVCEVQFGQGANMSFRKAVLEEIGLFDPNYVVKAYGEESDVFERLRRAGKKVLYNPRAAVSHEPVAPAEYGRGAFDRRGVFYMNRNFAYFFTKFYLGRLPFFTHLLFGAVEFGWKCLKRIAVIVTHTLLVFLLSLAGKAVGVWEGIKWHLPGSVKRGEKS